MANDIYDQHRAAFRNVSAYAILKDGKLVAKIAFKFPKDGASKLWAYVHWLGVPMVRGYAGGYGYDKMTAACASAARHLAGFMGPEYGCDNSDTFKQFARIMLEDGGHHWDDALRSCSFVVWQVV